jgi:hypothetical protein
MGIGIDETITYVRESIEYKENIIEKYFSENLLFNNNILNVNCGVILFCGKIYPFLKLTYTNPKNSYDKREICAYSTNEVRNFLFKNEIDLSLLDRYGRRWRGLNFNIKDIDKFFTLRGFEIPYDVFFKYNVPVISVEYPNADYITTLNPRLKNFNFYIVKDTYSAFQEISMFLSGVLGVNSPKIVVISDKYMRDKKGFDNMSFKTLAPGKKYNRRNK